MTDPRTRIAVLATVALLTITFAACGGGSYETARHDDEEYSADDGPETVSETLVAAKLAGADLVDGEEDFVVSRCPGCMLAMDGQADHAIEVDGYELHFCSDSCKSNFEEDAMANIARLEIPEE